jgi:hypothetical protein
VLAHFVRITEACIVVVRRGRAFIDLLMVDVVFHQFQQLNEREILL